jgi:hypothetical protein
MTHEAAAERLRPIILAVRLRDRAEELHPRLAVVELVRVVHDVAHLVAQVPQDVGVIEALDVPDLLAVQRREIGVGKVERDADDDVAERHAPLRREVKARHDLDAGARKLRAKLVDDGLQPRTRDLEAEVADRRAEQVGLTKDLRRGHSRCISGERAGAVRLF